MCDSVDTFELLKIRGAVLVAERAAPPPARDRGAACCIYYLNRLQMIDSYANLWHNRIFKRGIEYRLRNIIIEKKTVEDMYPVGWTFDVDGKMRIFYSFFICFVMIQWKIYTRIFFFISNAKLSTSTNGILTYFFFL